MQVLRELDLPIDGTSLKRLKKAIDAVDRGIVVGRKRDYWVIPRLYCSCDDFYINVISRKSTPLCYHLLAQAIAERTGKYDVFNVSDEEGERLEEEWRRVL
jgi:predicted nucleic acid-binding Zn finger protein